MDASSKKSPIGDKTRDRAATEARLVAAAFDALALHGFAGLGVNAVARAAGCDKALIYRYFGGLDGLLDAMGARVAADLAAALAPALDPRPPTYAAMVERLALALFDHVAADARYRRLRALELADPAAAARFRAARGEALRGWIAAARGDLHPPEGRDAPATNAALIAAAEGLAMGGAELDGDAAGRAREALEGLVRAAYGMS